MQRGVFVSGTAATAMRGDAAEGASEVAVIVAGSAGRPSCHSAAGASLTRNGMLA